MLGAQISGTSVAVVLLFMEVNASCDCSISRSVEEQSMHAVACIPRIARRARTDAGSRRACLRHTKSDFRLQGSPYGRAVYVARVPHNVRMPTLQITRTAISRFGAILGNAWESSQKHIHCLDWERRTFVAPRPEADRARPTPGVVTHGRTLLTSPHSVVHDCVLSGRRGKRGGAACAPWQVCWRALALSQAAKLACCVSHLLSILFPGRALRRARQCRASHNNSVLDVAPRRTLLALSAMITIAGRTLWATCPPRSTNRKRAGAFAEQEADSVLTLT
ncbi:hypothetical protein C8Q78DRAFT_544854 [Trametes maxima]|nr:hypothetical protein C8Q78DRAFT_544854 [Trametes maxima]